MKRTILLSLSLTLAASFLTAADPSVSVEKSVLDAEKAWVAAVMKGDKAALDKLLRPDLTYTHSSAKTQTKAEFIADVTGGTTKYSAIDFEGTKVRQFGNAAVVTHNATITSVPTGTSHLYITEVWALEGGHWQMASRQATKIAP
jgi:Domain of unknown function (DUF4440)